MMKPMRKSHALFKIMNNALVDLPAPNNLSIWWNMGSLLGYCLAIQIITGIILAMHYTPHIDIAFSSVAHITRDVNYGWLFRNVHANGASLFFLCIYMHAGRSMYYGSYAHMETWNIGVVLLILTMMTAFMGYVLVWGQMSFWGATVITNLFSAMPYIGEALVQWMWGGFAVDNATLNRFFAIHFFVPFVILGFTIIHLMFLHLTGSNNPLGINSDCDKIPFHWYYSTKDIMGFSVVTIMFSMLILLEPNMLGDPENFLPANPLVTPTHIKPEWYFLWAYAILRSIPNKLGGVVAMFSAILILFTLPFTICQKRRSSSFYPMNQILFWSFVTNILLLTWIGGCPVEAPYDLLGQLFTIYYFLYFMITPIMYYMWDTLL